MNKIKRLHLLLLLTISVVTACSAKPRTTENANAAEIITLLVIGDGSAADRLAKILPQSFYARIDGARYDRDIIVQTMKQGKWHHFRGERFYMGITDRYPSATVTPLTVQHFVGKNSITGERYEIVITWDGNEPLHLEAEKKESFGPVAKTPIVFWNGTIRRAVGYSYTTPGIVIVAEGRVIGAIRQLDSIKTEKDVREVVNRRRTVPMWVKSDARYIDLKGRYLIPGWVDAWVEPDTVDGFTRLLRSGVTSVAIPFDQQRCLELKALFEASPRLGPRVFCPAHLDVGYIGAAKPSMFSGWQSTTRPLVVLDGVPDYESLDPLCKDTPIICSVRNVADRVIFHARHGVRMVWGIDTIMQEFAGSPPWKADDFISMLDSQSDLMHNLYQRYGRYRFFVATGLSRLYDELDSSVGPEERQRIQARIIPELRKMRDTFVFIMIGSGVKAGRLGFWRDFSDVFTAKSHHVFDSAGVMMPWAFGVKNQTSYIGQGGPADMLIYDEDPFDKSRSEMPRPVHVYRAGYLIR